MIRRQTEESRPAIAGRLSMFNSDFEKSERNHVLGFSGGFSGGLGAAGGLPVVEEEPQPITAKLKAQTTSKAKTFFMVIYPFIETRVGTDK